MAIGAVLTTALGLDMMGRRGRRGRRGSRRKLCICGQGWANAGEQDGQTDPVRQDGAPALVWPGDRDWGMSYS